MENEAGKQNEETKQEDIFRTKILSKSLATASADCIIARLAAADPVGADPYRLKKGGRKAFPKELLLQMYEFATGRDPAEPMEGYECLEQYDDEGKTNAEVRGWRLRHTAMPPNWDNGDGIFKILNDKKTFQNRFCMSQYMLGANEIKGFGDKLSKIKITGNWSEKHAVGHVMGLKDKIRIRTCIF